MSNIAALNTLEEQTVPIAIFKDTYCKKDEIEIQMILKEIGKIYSKYFAENPGHYDL